MHRASKLFHDQASASERVVRNNLHVVVWCPQVFPGALGGRPRSLCEMRGLRLLLLAGLTSPKLVVIDVSGAGLGVL